MSKQTEPDEFPDIIKSGFVGAFALIGLSIILMIAGMRSQIVSSLIEAIFKIVPSIPWLFIIIGSIGFILGLVLRRRFPIIQNGILLLVLAIIVLVLPLGFVAWFVHTASLNMEYPPLSLKLADCTNNMVNIHLEVPSGHDYRLDLKTPETIASYTFTGHLRISSNGALIADLPIGSDKSWLTGSGYVLTGAGMQNTNVPPLSKFIQSHKSYDFEISFEPPPPPGSSIWFYCLVYGRDQ
jgi:hypothetical protein